MPVPDINSPVTRNLIEKLSPRQEPFFVNVELFGNTREKECIENVQHVIDKNGGECILGWALWEWPMVFVEGEFHAVWRKPDGGIVDVTPRCDMEFPTLFLPDPNAVIDRWQVDNVRMPLSRRREILDYIEIKERIFRERWRGVNNNSMFYFSTPRLEYLISEEAKIYRRIVRIFGNPPK